MNHLVLAWMPGLPEIAIILVIVLLLFGNRLPGMMRSLGSSVTEFKKGMNESEDEEQEKMTEE